MDYRDMTTDDEERKTYEPCARSTNRVEFKPQGTNPCPQYIELVGANPN